MTDIKKCEPTREKLTDFVIVRSPMVTLLMCVFAFGCTFIVYGNMILDNTLLPDPDVEVSWNDIFDNLNDLNYCLDNTNSEFTPAVLNKHAEEYHVVSLTSRVEYLPQENYYDGAYHNDSDSYPTSYAFTLKPTDIGVLPLEQPKNSKDEKTKFEYKKDMTIFVTMQISKRYDSKQKCQATKIPNRYGPGYDEDWSCDADDKLYACYSFYFHKKLYEHTADLVHAKIPKVRINDAEDDSTLDSSYECPKISSDVKTMGQAKYQDLAVGASPCHSRLYFHSKHSKDNGLVKMLDQETRKMIQQRLFWFGMVFIGICMICAIFGAFRGSVNAIHLFKRNSDRRPQSGFIERESTESQRLVN